jgi:RimJ/RimL family protein N-acetyltransferase
VSDPAPIEPFAPPVTLRRGGVTLRPLTRADAPALAAAAADGELWRLIYTSIPDPGEEAAYIDDALTMQAAGTRLPFAIIDEATGDVVGSTSYHDIVPGPRRVEIGYTWYSERVQRTHVNTTCKLMLLIHAFDELGCSVVGWRTAGINHASQAAIARLGATRDGTFRRNSLHKDGTLRDTVLFSMLAEDWPAARDRLEARLASH